jgi:hypothetical protein
LCSSTNFLSSSKAICTPCGDECMMSSLFNRNNINCTQTNNAPGLSNPDAMLLT